jgi:hypothetical protein
MKGLQKKLQAVASMPLEEARAEYARLSTLIEFRFGSNRIRRRLSNGDKANAAQLGRLRAALLSRINEEGTLTNDER